MGGGQIKTLDANIDEKCLCSHLALIGKKIMFDTANSIDKLPEAFDQYVGQSRDMAQSAPPPIQVFYPDIISIKKITLLFPVVLLLK